MEYRIEQIKKLYRSSSAKVYEKLKAGDKLYPNNHSLQELLSVHLQDSLSLE